MYIGSCLLLFTAARGVVAGIENPRPQLENVFTPTWEERWRPQFHLSTPVGWGNDPNGLVFDGQRYHVFYQHSPHTTVWGPMHWRWATSTDLFTWTDHGVAIEPRGLREPGNDITVGMAFSGQAVLDTDNVSGYGNNSIVLMWTDHTDFPYATDGRTVMEDQRIGYITPNTSRPSGYGDVTYVPLDSAGVPNDLAHNVEWWAKTTGAGATPGLVGPVPFERDNRDPKIVRIGDTYIMALANCDRITFYSSTNLREWKPESGFGTFDGTDPRTNDMREHDWDCNRDLMFQQDVWGVGGQVWECPDLFPLTVEGSDQTYFILIVSIGARDETQVNNATLYDGPNKGSATMYFVGDFQLQGDVWRFNPVEDPSFYPKWLDHGPDSYAGVTYYMANRQEAIFQGWLSNWIYAQRVPTFPWRSGMTLARSLKLIDKGVGQSPNFIITQEFISLSPLRRERRQCNVSVNADCSLVRSADPGLEVIAQFTGINGADGVYKLRFDNGLSEDNSAAEFVEVGLWVENGVQTFKVIRGGSINPFSSAWEQMTENIAPRLSITQSTMNMHVVFDTSSVEVLFDDGEVALTALFFPFVEPLWQQRYSVTSGQATVETWGLRSTVVTRSDGSSKYAAICGFGVLSSLFVLLGI